jgi:uncharacterized membrane protein
LNAVTWTLLTPAVLAAFLASLVEAVEALTVVLAASTIGGWRAAGMGAFVGACALVLLVLALGPLLDRVPLSLLQLAIGILLLLFGMRWLRKAVLRAAGRIDQRDEARLYEAARAALRRRRLTVSTNQDLLAASVSFKAVLIEGLEVVFIVIAVGTSHGLLVPAGVGAIAACALVAGLGLALRRPLSRVPEYLIKFGVGILLSAFGVFWVGEGLGISWPGSDLVILVFVALFLTLSLGSMYVVRALPVMRNEGCRSTTASAQRNEV